MMSIMKKQMAVALLLLLLIPVVWLLGGFLSSLINPEIAAGHPNYVRNYQLLTLLQHAVMLGSAAVVAILWLLACFLVIRSKQRSWLWLGCTALGPLGFAILATLNVKGSAELDRYTRFVRGLNGVGRAGFELSTFVILWLLAYLAMILYRNLMILYESVTTGVSTAQIIDLQNASSGMWAFAEGMEVMYLVVLLYLIRPTIFNIVGYMASIIGRSNSPQT